MLPWRANPCNGLTPFAVTRYGGELTRGSGMATRRRGLARLSEPAGGSSASSRSCANARASASTCAGTGLTPPTSAPGPGSPRPHLRRGRAHPLATSAPGLGTPRPHLRRDQTRPAHICTGTGPSPSTSAPGLGSPRPHLRRDSAHRQPLQCGALPRLDLRTAAGRRFGLNARRTPDDSARSGRPCHVASGHATLQRYTARAQQRGGSDRAGAWRSASRCNMRGGCARFCCDI